MYKQKLLAHGAKHLIKRKGQLKYTRKTGSGISDIDKYLLSLVGGMNRLKTQATQKPKASRKTSKYGGALHFIR